MGYNTMFTGI